MKFTKLLFYVYGATGWGALFVETNLRIIVAILNYLAANACVVDYWIKCKSVEYVVQLESNIPGFFQFNWIIDLIGLSLSHTYSAL